MNQITVNTSSNDIGLVLLGNKCDAEPRVIQKSDGEKMADELGVKYFETSAMNGTNISESFQFLAEEILKKKNINLNSDGTNNPAGIVIGQNVDGKKKGCCE